MKKLVLMSVFCGFSILLRPAWADSFGSGQNEFAIDFVTIGNPGNAGDPDTHGNSFGSVDYVYRMGVHEISREQVDKAVASGLTGVSPTGGTGQKPVTEITWYEAAAFVNWLNASQGYERAYSLTWNEYYWTMELWPEEESWQVGKESRFRNKDAFYFLPSEDEWYKSAYFDPMTGAYYDYATGSDDPPIRILSGTDPGTAVTDGNFNPGPYGPANVKEAGGLSPFGTMAQAGNVFEMTQTAVDFEDDESDFFRDGSIDEYRAIRGGDWHGYSRSDFRAGVHPGDYRNDGLGFRVASVPEPSVAGLIVLAGFGMLAAKGRGTRRS